MALIKCHECGKEISDQALACPHCGAPPNVQASPEEAERQSANEGTPTAVGDPEKTDKKGSPAAGVIFILLLVAGLGFFGFSTYEKQQEADGVRARIKAAASTDIDDLIRGLNAANPVKLSLLSRRCSERHGFMFIEGEVKNITDRPLKNVMAVGIYWTSDNVLVTSEDALIAFNPLMPGQTSPFKVAVTRNPLIKSCEIDFKFIFGEKIKWEDD